MPKPKPDASRSARLKQARIAAGYISAAEAAKVLGLSDGTYGGHENGWRGFSIEDAQRYARRFKVTLEWLLTGRDSDVPVHADGPGGNTKIMKRRRLTDREKLDLFAPLDPVQENLVAQLLRDMARDDDPEPEPRPARSPK